MGRDVWWDWRSDWSTRTDPDLTTDQQRMEAVVELASRCILLEDLPAIVTAQGIDSSLDQFGTVLGIKLVKNPVDQKFTGRALVEMESTEMKVQVMKQFKAYLFMVGGLPRPVRVSEVSLALLVDHPWRRNPNIAVPSVFSKSCKGQPLFDILREKERIAMQKLDDEQMLHKDFRREEKLRARKQNREVTETKEKLEMIAVEMKSGSIDELKKLYNIRDGPQDPK